jgi:hypothetical protein
MSSSKVIQKAVMHQHQKHHQNEIWIQFGEFPNTMICDMILRHHKRLHLKKPKSYKIFGVLPSIFARVLRHVLTKNFIALKRIHKPTDQI